MTDQNSRLNYIKTPIELVACPFFTLKEKEVIAEIISLSDKYLTNGGCCRTNKSLAFHNSFQRRRSKMNDQKISFNPNLAADIGVNPSIMLEFLASMQDSKNSWIYCSVAEFSKKIPFFKNYTICESLSTLEAEKYIISKNIKTHPFDRTNSYQLTKKAWRVIL